MNTTMRLRAICAALLLAVLVVACGGDDDERPGVGALVCIHDTSQFQINLPANRVYEVVEPPRYAAAEGDRRVWIDVDPESSGADEENPSGYELGNGIVEEVDDEEFAPGDSC